MNKTYNTISNKNITRVYIKWYQQSYYFMRELNNTQNVYRSIDKKKQCHHLII